ncbi:MAG: patatin-like phospholipase family protein [Tatlockia sp.]|nr:patatin-like phospholipase family protein [Tatlockia sp.]
MGLKAKHSLSFFILIACILLQSCINTSLYKPLPQNLEKVAYIRGFNKVRAFGDGSSIAMELSAQKSITQMLNENQGRLPKELNALALSGGGADGAFGAGLLYGWSKSGKRPVFHLVTGISTGALIAPFAFLGSDYDEQLKAIYTSLSDKHIFEYNNVFSIIFSYIKPILRPSIASNKPLERVISKVINQSMLEQIKKEHLKGRRLFIGTTQLNAQRLVIWDIGAIAVIGGRDALNLVHKILLASSALPGIFPPQYFLVVANQKNYKEMHIDGGVVNQVMLYERAIVPFAQIYVNNKTNLIKRLYIIRNSKVTPEWKNVIPLLHDILGRVILTLTKNQGIGDLYRLYAFAVRDHIDYNLAYIPNNFKQHSNTLFDTKYMNNLFNLGEKLSIKGYPWEKYPPGLHN